MFRFSQVLQIAVTSLGLLCSSQSMAQAETGQADIDGFLLLTDRGDELLHARRTGTMHTLELEKLEVAPLERFLTAIVAFSGCAANADGNCDATVDYVLFNPEGDIYGDALNDVELWQDKPAVAPGMYELSVEYMGIVIDSDDPPGQYRLEATINDRVSGNTDTFEWAFQVR